MPIVKDCRYISVPPQSINGREVVEPIRVDNGVKLYVFEAFVLFSIALVLQYFNVSGRLTDWAYKFFMFVCLTILIVWGIALFIRWKRKNDNKRYSKQNN